MIASVLVMVSACLGVDFQVLTIPKKELRTGVFPAQLDAGAGANDLTIDVLG